MKEWTVMVCMAGNNNLSDDMISAINGIRTGMSSTEGKIAFTAQYDCQHPSVPTQRYEFSDGNEGFEAVNKGMGTNPSYFSRTKNFPLNLKTFGGEG